MDQRLCRQVHWIGDGDEVGDRRAHRVGSHAVHRRQGEADLLGKVKDERLERPALGQHRRSARPHGLGAHRDLDDVIARLSMDIHVDEIQLKRLKKRKLMLKDQIERYGSHLIPDLNA